MDASRLITRLVDVRRYADERARRSATLLQILLLGNIVVTVVLFVLSPLSSQPAIAAGVLGIGLVQTGLSLWWSRRGFATRAGLYYTLTGWAALSGMSWLFDGVRSPFLIGVPVVILTSALAVGRRIGIGFTVASVLHVIALAIADPWLPEPITIARTSDFAMAAVFAFTVTGLLAVLAIATVEQTIGRADELVERLRNHNLVLDQAERIAKLGVWRGQHGSDAVEWSDGMRRLLGLPDDTIPSAQALARCVHPDDAASLEHYRLAKPSDRPFRYRIVRGDEVRTVEVYQRGTDDREGFVEVIRDVTERAELDARFERTSEDLRETQKAARVGAWRQEITGDLRWSPEVYEQLGIPTDVTPTVERLYQAIHPEDRARILELQRGAGGDRVTAEFRALHPDGSIRHLYTHVVPIRDARGEITHFAGANIDMTPIRRLEAELRQSQKLDAIGQLAAGVAHDFNNLLMVMLINAEELRELPAARELAGEILDAGARASEFTRQLLAVGRQSAMKVESVNLDEVVQSTMRLLRRVIGEHIELVVVGASEPAIVGADVAMLTQVLLNLAVNARDAMQDGGTFTLSTSIVELAAAEVAGRSGVTAGRFVRLDATDTGVGMEDSVRTRVFEPFFTTKPQGKGTGLGLSTAYGIVAQGRGFMTVDSTVGSGTRFSLFLPVAKILEVTHVDSPRERVIPRGRIALIEDDIRVREVMLRALRRAGYEVVAFASGDVFLEDQSRFELVISDVVMPGISGPEIYAALRARDPGMPFLFVTGYAPDRQALGDVPVLEKPFTSEQLLQKIVDVMGLESG